MDSGRSSEDDPPPERSAGVFPGAARVDPGRPPDTARYYLRGAPLDATTSGRPGARNGPGAIRRAARHQEPYDHRTGTRIDDLGVGDAGDRRAWPDPDAYLDFLAGELRDAGVGTDAGPTPVLLGGEHTVTLAGLRATAPTTYVALDAHLDLRRSFDGLETCHATVARRALDLPTVDRVVVIGARSGSAAEWERAAAADVTIVPPDAVSDWTPSFDGPAYLSVDVDAADPAAAPATGTLAPGGLTARELLDCVRGIAPHAVGGDVVEVADDAAGPTAALGAACVRAFVHAHAAGRA